VAGVSGQQKAWFLPAWFIWKKVAWRRFFRTVASFPAGKKRGFCRPAQ
jgi:hypothetical protein